MKITAGGTDGDSESTKDAKFEFTPPELLLDTPFNMGCYKLSDSELPSAEEQNFDMSPAACILKCAPKGSDYRLAGIVRYIYRMESIHLKNIYICEYIYKYTILFFRYQRWHNLLLFNFCGEFGLCRRANIL